MTEQANHPATEPKSLFNDFGGHYSVLRHGTEIARFAPSPQWSDYASTITDDPDFTYRWVPRDETGAKSRSPLRHRLNDLIDAYAEEPHSGECGFGPCVRCVVNEFVTALDASASPVPAGGSDV